MFREESKPCHEVAGQERDGQEEEISNFIIIIIVLSLPDGIFSLFFFLRER